LDTGFAQLASLDPDQARRSRPSSRPIILRRVFVGIDPNRADGYRVRPLWHGMCSTCLQSPQLKAVRGRSTAGPSHSRRCAASSNNRAFAQNDCDPKNGRCGGKGTLRRLRQRLGACTVTS
jgi:hypothetical protein